MKPFLLGGAVLALTTALAAAQTTPAPAPDATGATTTAPRPAAPAVPARRFPGSAGREGATVPGDRDRRAAGPGPGDQRRVRGEGRQRAGPLRDQGRRRTTASSSSMWSTPIRGQVIKTENQPIERFFTRLKPADFQNARMSLKDAIATAEQRAGAGARAVEAEVDRENNAVVYEIEVATAERSQEVKVDANGQVVSTD